MKKTTILLLISLFVLISVAFAPTAKGYKYSSAEGKMTVTFPAAFETEVNSQNDIETTKITAIVDEQTFFAAYTLHQTELEDQIMLAQIALDSFSETLNGNILQQSAWKIKKNEGVQAVLNLDEQDAKIQYRVIMIGNLQYQLVVIAANSSFDQKAADSFFKSFKVKK